MIVNCRTFVIANISNNKLSVIYILKSFEQVEQNMRLIFLTHLVRHSVLEKLRMRTLKKSTTGRGSKEPYLTMFTGFWTIDRFRIFFSTFGYLSIS